MKRNNYKNIKTILLGGIILLGASACTDDHFDVKNISPTATKTLLANIKEQPSIKNFNTILERTFVMKDEHDTKGKSTYAQLLSQPAYYTVWAPLDGKYDADKIIEQLNKRDELLKLSSDPESKSFKEAWAINYNIANQFVLNHIALFNHEANPNVQRVGMLNAKIYNLDISKNLFNAIPITTENIPSSNGLLHTIEGVSPFTYNIYEYLREDSQLSKVGDAITSSKFLRRTFSPSMSTPGAMNNDGKMVYVDSVYSELNQVLINSRAQLLNEDSIYVAVLPSNKAWDAAYSKMSNIYKYGTTYAFTWNKSKGEFVNSGIRALKVNADSLQDRSAEFSILTSSYFTTSRLPISNQKDSTEIVNYITHADSLISTSNIIFYNQNAGKSNNINPIFNGQKPISASNGYIYAVDQYNIDPAYSVIPNKRVIDLIYSSNVASTKGDITAAGSDPTFEGTLVRLTDEDKNPEVKGTLKSGYYRRFVVDGSNTLTVFIPLKNIYSTKYKISAVILPNRVNLANVEYDSRGEEIHETTQFSCEIRDDHGSLIKNSQKIKVSEDTIQAYTLFDNVEIPKCYVNLPAGYETFPTLRFVMSRIDQRKGKSKALNIAYIIIEPIREESN